MCSDSRYFEIAELRVAVAYLRSVASSMEITTRIGLAAIAETVEAGSFKLDPQPMLHLSDIEGKTPSEVWDAFDLRIDASIAGLTRSRSGLSA